MIYLVGSDEDHFIVDCIYSHKEDALAYCKSRKNSQWTWSVLEADLPSSFIQWKRIYTEEKK